MNSQKNKVLVNTKIDIKIKLAALWIVFMFLYVYTDFYKLYLPGKIQAIISGEIDGFDVTQMSLFLIAIVTIIPACMAYLSLVINGKCNRLLNIIFGIFHLAIGIVNIVGTTWHFYMFYGALLILVAILIILTAWKWPVENDSNND